MPDKKLAVLVFMWALVGYAVHSGSLLAQQYTISGRVIDMVNDEPVPFANIFFKGSAAGTQTDFDGNYTIKLYSLPDSIMVSSLSYLTVSKPLKKQPTQVVNFKMDRSSVNLIEVTVESGESPVRYIMRQVIANRQETTLENVKNYYTESYNKVELDLYNLDKFQDRRIMRPFQFIFDNIDSTSEETPFLPTFLTETLSDLYYRQSPKQKREVIKATRISGVSNGSMSQFTGSLYQEVDVKENWVDLLQKDFASPIGENAFNYYKFYLLDSAWLDGNWSYHISFAPKSKGTMTFLGDMWVSDLSYALKKVDLQLPEGTNVNWVDRCSVVQEFAEVEPGIWMIVRDKIVVKFTIVEGAVGIIGRKTNTFKDFVINDPFMDTIFVDKMDVVYGSDVIEESDTFWDNRRHEELNAAEDGIYEMVDSVMSTKAFSRWKKGFGIAFTGYQPLGPIDFGPYRVLFSRNRIEGWRFRLGFITNDNFSERIQFGAYGAYGVRDGRFKYGFEGSSFIIKEPRLQIGGSYIYDMDLSAKDAQGFGGDNFLTNLVRRPKVPIKLSLNRTWDTWIYKEFISGFSLRGSLRNREIQPQFDFFYLVDDQKVLNDSIISNFNTTDVEVQLRFAFKEKFITGTFNRLSMGSDYPIVLLKYMQGIKGLFGSQFAYHRVDFWLYDDFPINPIGEFYYTLNVGKVFGDLPSQLLEVHPGNETFFYSNYQFSLMNQYEFISDMYAALFVRHEFQGFILDKIPGVRKLKWRTLITAKAVVGTMTAANKEANKYNTFKVPFPKPYVEAGFGIENILKIFRIDSIWRVTYRNDAKALYTPNWGIMIGLKLNL